MKRQFLFIYFGLVLSLLTVNAQDIITKINGDEVKAKIMEINTDEIKYKKFINLSGPSYVMQTLDIFMVKYENGDKDLFERNPQTGKITIRNIIAEKPVSKPEQKVAQKSEQKPIQQKALASTTPALMTSKELLEKYSACKHVKPEDNKLGLTIESISKERENSFLIQWKSSSDIIMKSPRNNQYTVLLMYFIDPNDPDNIKNGLNSEFRGDIGKMDKMIVTLDKPAKSLIIYFEGIDKSIPNSEEFFTSPLFFMAELGNNPRLLDKSPRYAGDLFKEIVENSEKKDTK